MALVAGFFVSSLPARADCDLRAVEGVYQWRERAEDGGNAVSAAGQLMIRRDGVGYWKGEAVSSGKRRLFERSFLYHLTPDCRTLVEHRDPNLRIDLNGRQLSWNVTYTNGDWGQGEGQRVSVLTAEADQMVERAAQEKIRRSRRGVAASNEAGLYTRSCKPGDSSQTFACKRFDAAMHELSLLCHFDGDFCKIYTAITVERTYNSLTE